MRPTDAHSPRALCSGSGKVLWRRPGAIPYTCLLVLSAKSLSFGSFLNEILFSSFHTLRPMPELLSNSSWHQTLVVQLSSEHLFSASVAMELCLAPFRAWLRCTSQAEEKASHALGSMSKLCAKNPWKLLGPTWPNQMRTTGFVSVLAGSLQQKHASRPQ